MDFKQLFGSMEGRIGRQSWWIGTIIVIVASFILYFILSAIFGIGWMMNPQQMMEPGFIESYTRKASILQIVMLVILGYPVTAIMAKRLNDRDRPSWMKWLFWAPTVLTALVGLLGLGYTTTEVGGVQVPTSSALMSILGVASLVIGLWALVELGILKGTEGSNQHGPDPLAA